ncbi:MAG: AarF/ABC1/UbiB kinase family protein [bacterium]
MTGSSVYRTYRNLKRYREVVGVLVKYGFGEVLDRMGIAAYLRLGRRRLFAKQQELASHTWAERIRLALEELGPTFVKLGQILSTRPFMIPVELTVELSKLQDEVAPFAYEQVREIIREELGKEIEQLFTTFDREPIASASLSQVHRAVLKSGEQVAVKVQRPLVREVMSKDVAILRDLAALLNRYVPEAQQFDPVGIVEEAWRTAKQEIDFTFEARNLEVFTINFLDDERVFLPKIYWGLTSRRVLTLEFINGIKISQKEKLLANGIDPETVVRNGGQLVAKMVFEDGYFHADPHPGNLFAMSDNRIAPVDFGMMGKLSASSLDLITDLLIAATSADARRLVRVLQSYELVSEDADAIALETDINYFLHRYHKIPLARIDMRTLLDEAFSMISAHQVKMPPELLMLGKALVTYEEVARGLYPEYDFVTELLPSIKKLAGRKFKAGSIIHDLSGYLVDLRDLLVNFPFELRRITRKLRKGELGLTMQHKGLENLTQEIEKSSNRLSFSMIIAALIIGSSLIMTRQFGWTVYGIPVLGILGYVIAAVLGIGLVISIIRSGKL